MGQARSAHWPKVGCQAWPSLAAKLWTSLGQAWCAVWVVVVHHYVTSSSCQPRRLKAPFVRTGHKWSQSISIILSLNVLCCTPNFHYVLYECVFVAHQNSIMFSLVHSVLCCTPTFHYVLTSAQCILLHTNIPLWSHKCTVYLKDCAPKFGQTLLSTNLDKKRTIFAGLKTVNRSANLSVSLRSPTLLLVVDATALVTMSV